MTGYTDLRKKLILSFAVIGLLVGCGIKESARQDNEVSTAEIRNTDSGYQLFVNDQPFYINGAGLEFGSIEKLAAHGGNSFRTWRTDNGRNSGKEVLDKAQQLGLKVTMGIEVARERHGFDYNDEQAVKEQLERIRGEVMELKDHPALIIWGIGNELNLSATNPKVWDAVNDISKMIHEVDENHLTTTSLAGISKELVVDIKSRTPDLDLLSVQMYADIVKLPGLIEETGWEGPYMITEWGATGHWEIAKTSWGAPIENNSSTKADFYRQRFETSIGSQKQQCIGSYVFLWGQKQERTPTWYGIFLEDGSETESVDVMQYLWTGSWPENRSPRIESYSLNGGTASENITLLNRNTYSAKLIIKDPEGDSITYRWEIMNESQAQQEGGDKEEVPAVLPDLIKAEKANEVEFVTPDEPGAYRLFVYAYDGHGHAAHANIPFYVEEASKK